MASVAGAVIVSVALSYLANRFFAPDTPDPLVDDTPTTLSRRGAFIPRVWGTRRVGPVFAWAGNRRTEEKKAGGGGGSDFGGGGAGGGTLTYFEKGWHAICVGPVFSLIQIRKGSTPLLDNIILASDNPSGSAFSQGNSNYRFYWGTCDQEPDPIISSSAGTRVGIASGWPFLCYAFWDDRNLGGSPNWPQLDYTVQTRPINSPLTGSDAWLDNGTSTGWNPAHLLYELITGEFPHGANRPPEFLDLNRFEQLGALMEGEHLALNFMAKDGVSAARLVADILQDCGILLPQVGNTLVPWPIRETLTPFEEVIPTFDQSNIEAPPPEIEIKYTDQTGTDRMVFSFPSEDNRYRAFDLVIDDDSQAQVNHARKDSPINLPTITNFDIAANAADRRQLELLTNTDVVKGKFNREARLLSSGQRFNIAGVGTFRTLTNKILTDQGACNLEYIADAYSDPPTGFIPDAPDPETQIPDRNESIPASDDVAFDFYEVPCTISQNTQPIIFGVRGRDNQSITGAVALVSLDDTTYTNLGSAGVNMNTGLLDEAIPLSTNVLIEQGPLVTLDTLEDVDLINDLSGDNGSWLSGTQICLINDEWFYLRNITIISGAQIRLEGLARFREGSYVEAHGIGDRVWIMRRLDLELLTGPIAIGQLLYYKSVPFTESQVADETTITPVTHNIIGLGFEPLAVTALRTDNVDTDFRGNIYDSGQDAVMNWNYRECNGGGVLLGEQVSGVVINNTFFPSVGKFHYQILDSADVVVREADIAKDLFTFTYTAAQITTDFGTPPDLFKFQIKSWDATENRDSEYVQIVVIKDAL